MAKKAKTTSTARAVSSSPSAGAKGKASSAAKKTTKAASSAKVSVTKSVKVGTKQAQAKPLAKKTVASVAKAATQAVPIASGKKPEKKPERKSDKKTSDRKTSDAKLQSKPEKADKRAGKTLASTAEHEPKPKEVALKVVEAAPQKREKKKLEVAPAEATVVVEENAGNLAEEGAGGSEGKAPEKKKKRDELKIDRAGDLTAQWQVLYDRTKATKPVAYKMSESYEARTPLMHKVLGWGYVLVSQNNRLEVLFKDGIKILIANYKGG